LDTPALEKAPSLAPDLKKILQTFLFLSRRRPQTLGSEPPAIPSSEIIAGWEISGWKDMGMPLREFSRWMDELDSTFIEFKRKR